MSESERDCARQILETMPLLNRWLAAQVRTQTESISLTVPQFRVLHYVQRRGGCSPSDVARWRDVAAATMSRTVDTLVEKGLLERRRSAEDRRRVYLHLTPAGERFVAEMHAQIERALAAELAHATAEQRARIAAGLAELASFIGSPPCRP